MFTILLDLHTLCFYIDHCVLKTADRRGKDYEVKCGDIEDPVLRERCFPSMSSVLSKLEGLETPTTTVFVITNEVRGGLHGFASLNNNQKHNQTTKIGCFCPRGTAVASFAVHIVLLSRPLGFAGSLFGLPRGPRAGSG